MCNSALGLQMHLRLNYLSIYLSIYLRSAHRVVSTDSLIMPIVSEREKELART